MGAIGDLLAASEFRSGLVAGVIGVLVALTASRIRHGRKGLRAPAYLGAGFAGAGLVAIGGWLGFDQVAHRSVSLGLAAGLALLVVAGALARRQEWPAWARFLSAVPGAALVAGAVPGEAPGWATPTTFAVVTIGSVCFADLDRRSRGLGGVPLLFAISVAGAYATLPDTEVALVLVGAVVPLALLGLPWLRSTIGPGGAGAAIGLYVWAATVGGVGRPGSIVGALGTLGLIIMEPVARGVIRFGRPRPISRRGRKWLWLVLVGAQTVFALFAARVAGFETSASSALVQITPMLLVAMVLGAALPPFDAPRRRRPHHAKRATIAPLGEPSTST